MVRTILIPVNILLTCQKTLTPDSFPGSMVLLITPGGHMPITAFNSFTDGLEPNRRNQLPDLFDSVAVIEIREERPDDILLRD